MARALLGIALLSPAIAHAEPTAAERETARSLLLSGREKRKAGQLKEALADFERAHGIMHVPTTALDLGKSQEALGQLVEARATFLEGARYPTRADESRAYKHARAEAKTLAEAISPRLATLTLSVTSGARVKVDDADISASSIGAPLKVNPGKHDIVATLGTDEKRVTVELAEGGTRTLELALAASSSPAPAPPTPPVTPATTRTSPLMWVGLVTAGVGTVVGATTGIVALGIRSDVAGRCDGGVRCPPATYGDIDRGMTFGNVSTIAFVIAGLGVGVLVYGLLTPRGDTTTSTARIDWLRGTF